MEKSHKKETKEKILQAARKVFVHKGMTGARMQEIADEAGINKALLHYHFKNKETLFHKVFERVFKEMFAQINQLFSIDLPLFEKIERFVHLYLDMLEANPYLPMFIIYELNHSPENITGIAEKMNINLKIFMQSFEKEIKKGTIRSINPMELLVNIVALCVFPVVAKPMVSAIFTGHNEEKTNLFLDERKKTVPEFIINAIKTANG